MLWGTKAEGFFSVELDTISSFCFLFAAEMKHTLCMYHHFSRRRDWIEYFVSCF